MTVVDFDAHRRMDGRERDHRGGNRWIAAKDASRRRVREPASRAPSQIRGLGFVSIHGGPNSGAAVVSGAVIPHPLDQRDVVAFLVVQGSDAHTMLQSAHTAEFSFERDAPWGFVAGPVELVRANQVQADWFGWMVGEVFTAAGGTAADLAVHEATIGIPSTVVAFLRPERISRTRVSGTATANASALVHRQRRQAGHLVPLQGGRSA